MTPTALVRDELVDAVDVARARAEQTGAEYEQQAAKQRRLIDEANADDAERQQLEVRRQAILLDAMEARQPAAIAELETLPKRMALLEQRAQFAREAARQLQPAIDALAPLHQAAAQTVRVATYAVVEREHAAKTAAVRAAFEALQPLLVAWIRSAERIEQEHRATFGEPRRVKHEGAVGWRLMRSWNVWTRRMFARLFGDQNLDALTSIFPADSGQLE